MSNLNDYENVFLSSIYSKESEIYKKAIDSLIEEKNNIWNQFNKSVKQKRLSQNITKASIKYNYYNKLERYALLRGKDWNNDKREGIF
jgi:hypothetical protein